jgi:hypothetical protein
MENKKRKFVSPKAAAAFDNDRAQGTFTISLADHDGTICTSSPSPITLNSNLNDFITDEALIQNIQKAAADPDDPPLIFEWNFDAVQVFVNKIAQVPPGVAVAPFPLRVPTTIRTSKQDLIVYIQGLVPGTRLLSGPGGTVGLACTNLQYGTDAAVLGRLELHPWFVAVLASGAAPPLAIPLAEILVPRPRVSTGDCDVLPIGCVLWL